MKAKRYTIAMLIALIFAVASIQAQSARRPVSQQKKERERTAQKAESTNPVRKVQATKARSQQNRAVQPARKVQAKEPVRRQQVHANRGQQMRNSNVQKNHGQQVNRQYASNKQTVRTKPKKEVHKPVSMSTTKNPRSHYRKANKMTSTPARYHAPVKSHTHYKRGYYGGHHYHYAYPTTRVKLHYHHHTYLNNYGVLYYPSYNSMYWTRSMYRDYHKWYPGFHWSYSYGHRIQTISIWDAKFNLGEVAMIYGRVYATWYNKETDDYLLFFGGDFPYQQFTAVVPGHIARKYSWRPQRFFLGEHVTITGLITSFDGSPEIVIKHRRQLSLY
jgi:hypothetical protein